MLSLQCLLDLQEETSHGQVVPIILSPEGMFWVGSRHAGNLNIDMEMNEVSQQERGKWVKWWGSSETEEAEWGGAAQEQEQETWGGDMVLSGSEEKVW